MKSIKQMIERIEGLTDTRDVTEWENDFIKAMSERKDDTAVLSERQVQQIEQLYNKHFAG